MWQYIRNRRSVNRKQDKEKVSVRDVLCGGDISVLGGSRSTRLFAEATWWCPCKQHWHLTSAQHTLHLWLPALEGL